MSTSIKPVIKLRPKTETIRDQSSSEEQLPSLTDLLQLSALPEGNFYRPLKKQISIRMDADVLAWFQAQPGKYQQLINKACRVFMRLSQMGSR